MSALETYSFTVEGTPVPQGSMSVFNGRIVHQKSKELMAWRNAINNACRDVMEPLEGAVEVAIVFLMPRPKTVQRATPHVRPDVDKLARAVLDGLTGSAFADDAQVVKLEAVKKYGEAGARITIEGYRETRVEGSSIFA
jgi:crossover junction endodeoxyribonuclease RusA